jgi:branched-chain amino acid transport system ATP-binding protein
VSDPEIDAPPALLAFHHVDAAYGSYRALFDVSFSVPEASVVALIGSNGAGKSTVARVASGLVPVNRGQVWFAGQDITRLPPWKIARSGLAHLPEGRSVFATLSVEENLALTFRQALGRHGVDAAFDEAFESFPRLSERRGQLAGTLSGGEQRMLGLAKVLVVPQRLLIVDELSLGLAPGVLDEVFGALTQIVEKGTALLVVEQHVHRALEIANRVVILAKGRVVHEGPVEELGDLATTLLPGRAQSSAEGTVTPHAFDGRPRNGNRPSNTEQ